jgi:hypothetical protein
MLMQQTVKQIETCATESDVGMTTAQNSARREKKRIIRRRSGNSEDSN